MPAIILLAPKRKDRGHGPLLQLCKKVPDLILLGHSVLITDPHEFLAICRFEQQVTGHAPVSSPATEGAQQGTDGAWDLSHVLVRHFAQIPARPYDQ